MAAAPEEVPSAVDLSREVLDVVLRLGRQAGAYRLADVALDYQLTRASPARPALAALLGPLDDHPDLSRTLSVFLDTGLNRRRSAHALTGLDPAAPGDLPAITAALAARRS